MTGTIKADDNWCRMVTSISMPVLCQDSGDGPLEVPSISMPPGEEPMGREARLLR